MSSSRSELSPIPSASESSCSAGSFGNASALSPVPSPSVSVSSVGSRGKSSASSFAPSPSVSGLSGSVPLSCSCASVNPSLSLSDVPSSGPTCAAAIENVATRETNRNMTKIPPLSLLLVDFIDYICKALRMTLLLPAILLQFATTPLAFAFGYSCK